ncbi:MAG: hypothetical protein C0410_11590 [Anaerolinea sp.]|nr:hypothetical protein [Anaerolinea sp.]
MLEKLSARLTELDEQKRLKKKLELNLSSVQKDLKDKSSLLESLRIRLEKEKVDVEKLERTSLTVLFYSVLGSREQQLEKERQEMLSAQLQFQQTKYQVDFLEQEQISLTQQLGKIPDIDNEYLSVLSEKEKLLRQTNQPVANELIELDEKVANHKSEMKELGEAINAGKVVVSGLEQVIESLGSAESWGTWDMLGGGFISTAIKHSRIDEARNGILFVQTKMSQFRRELADVEKTIDLTINISEFNTFADYFFDDLIFDWIVQSKIVDSLNRSRQAKESIDKIINSLEDQCKVTQSKADELQEKRVQLVERT